jgi:hypothetical protein
VPAAWIVIPRGRGGDEPALTPLARKEALRALFTNCLNPDLHGAQAVAVLSQVVSAAACFSLQLGPPRATARLLRRLMEGPP